jgi:hypothetical protein
MSAKVHALTPEDELIGHLTRERITLLVQEAGHFSRNDLLTGRLWLAYAVNADIPVNAYDQLAAAYEHAEVTQTCDLDYWYDIPNTEENRAQLLRGADMIIDHTVIHLTNLLCAQLGVS